MNDKSESHPISLYHLGILWQRLKTTRYCRTVVQTALLTSCITEGLIYLILNKTARTKLMPKNTGSLRPHRFITNNT